MFNNQLYKILELKEEGQTIQAVISLNADHAIYEGHFPSNPVTPGVCQIQIVKDIISRLKGKPCFLVEAKNIKFLSMLTPQEKNVRLDLEYSEQNNQIKVKSQLSSGDKIFLKFSGLFVPENKLPTGTLP
ncbi:3-hydroxyacyl-ACP dehydratase [bacterium]|nr:3-hydroxyacyl-ACP dehydratase [bacterium]